MPDKRKAKKVLIVTGEASGDLHASYLVQAMLSLDPDVYCYGMGGEKLRAAGAHIVFDIAELSVMGITEVVRHFGKIYRVFTTLKGLLKNDEPDLVILVDYPDFNLRLAKVAHKYGVPVLYYIRPRSGRGEPVASSRLAGWSKRCLWSFPSNVTSMKRQVLM